MEYISLKKFGKFIDTMKRSGLEKELTKKLKKLLCDRLTGSEMKSIWHGERL